MKKVFVKISLVAVLFIGLFVAADNPASALSGAAVYDKAYLEGLHKCYVEGHLRTGTDAQGPLTVDSFPVFHNGPETQVNDGAAKSALIINDNDEDFILLPNGTGISDNGVSCNELFIGYEGQLGIGGKFAGLFKMRGVTVPSAEATPDIKANFMESIGYRSSDTSSVSGVCSALNFTKSNTYDERYTSAAQSASICVDNLEDGKITSSTKITTSLNGGSEMLNFSVDGSGKKMTIGYLHKEKSYGSRGETPGGAYVSTSVDFSLDDYSKWDDFINGVAGNFVNDAVYGSGCGTSYGGYTICDKYELSLTNSFTSNPLSSVSRKFVMDNTSDAANTAIRYFSGSDELANWDSLAYTNVQKVALYRGYLENVFEIEFYDGSCADVDEYEAERINMAGYKRVKWYGARTCYVKSSKESSIDSINGIKDDNHFGKKIVSDASGTAFQKLIDELNNIELSEEEEAAAGDEAGATQQQGDDKGSCKAGAAGALGWIVCPIMEWMADASENMYNEYVEPALRVDPKLFGDPGSSNTWQAWSIFQGIANTIFIIILLAVIFSQLTGVGIDNYGIKKILPKLIVAAVLVNLSYYICLICVDLSNIFGNGLQDMFMEMGKNLKPVPFDVHGGSQTSTVTIDLSPKGDVNSGAGAATVMTAMPILGALIAGGAAIYLNPAILLTLLISAIGIVVGIFFLFMLLSVREAAIVVLTVVSPIAFVLYILPNTKKLFDKWVGIWKALLVLYPICGLLVGGGSFVSRLLISSGASQGFISAFMAMVVGIAPIFFIPTLLKNSLNALGSLGAKISGLGQRIGGGLQKGARNSEAYKNAQKRGLENRVRIKAGVDQNGNLTKLGAWRARNASKFGARRQAAYISQAKKNIGESEAAGALLTGALARTGIAEAEGLPDSGKDEELGRSFAEHTEGAYYGGQFLEAADAGDITNMNATIEAMRSSGMKPKDIAKLMRYANNHGHFNNMNDNTRAAWFRELSKKYGNDFLATDFELNSYLRAGGFGRDASGNITGALGGYGEYGGVKIDDVKPEDIVKLSGDSMAGLAASGVLNQSMAQRVIAMNPNISADKKIMLGAIASGAANATTINDVAQFKKDAETLMKDYNAGSPVAPVTMNARGAINRATVEAWASATPQSVNVVQNFNGGGSQLESVDVDLRGIGGQKLGGTGGSTS